jgi:ABC-type multidrug transport system ATPase subunit
MQDDALMATATPREALMFSANMRLPPTTDKKTLESLVDKLLDDLGLTECADVLIGGALIKGISGGQRKRTSVGVEVITDPAVSYNTRAGSFSSVAHLNLRLYFLCPTVAVPG